MSVFLVLTVIGDDKPGLVEQLSTTISRHQGNWLESSMSHLAGKFAGILKVSVPNNQADALKAALGNLAQLKVIAETSIESSLRQFNRRLNLTLVGHDRIGIIREVSQVLAKYAVNVEKLTTYTSSAAMSGDLLFHAKAELEADKSLDAPALKQELEQLSNDLIVDITLDEIIAA
ncbi:glycine cleavage system regulatory protein [Chitinivorax tropicus]|uniref:Glycine cleavage system regulatory protein n=1 Tax=Chitinivorax tropicus TaxID=714531 RepID=A0A840MRH2_9PROT|nr:ACT domain-containing protein [Chitinivorax tropicus]MBB5018823.1 glycine cleavage system regulatory protein [Chitinivorax tropicus]